MKTLLSILSIILLLSCNTKRVAELEISEKQKSEKIHILEEAISQKEQRISELESKEVLSIQERESITLELVKLKEEKSVLEEKLSQETEDNFTIKDPSGKVIITDPSTGKKYEIEGGPGTEISSSSVSKLNKELKQTQSLLSDEKSTTQNLREILTQKESELKSKEQSISDLNKKLTEKTNELSSVEREIHSKNTTETKSNWHWWMIGGFALCVLLQLLWRLYIKRR